MAASHPSSFSLPRGRKLTVARPGPPLVMGILNVTPDSFSDGGVHFDHLKAVHAALQMEEDGAVVGDIGGGARRPGAGGGGGGGGRGGGGGGRQKKRRGAVKPRPNAPPQPV